MLGKSLNNKFYALHDALRPALGPALDDALDPALRDALDHALYNALRVAHDAAVAQLEQDLKNVR